MVKSSVLSITSDRINNSDSKIKNLNTKSKQYRNFRDGIYGHKLPFSPTAENIAKWICDETENCYKVEIWESENNKAIYEKE